MREAHESAVGSSGNPHSVPMPAFEQPAVSAQLPSAATEACSLESLAEVSCFSALPPSCFMLGTSATAVAYSPSWLMLTSHNWPFSDSKLGGESDSDRGSGRASSRTMAVGL